MNTAIKPSQTAYMQRQAEISSGQSAALQQRQAQIAQSAEKRATAPESGNIKPPDSDGAKLGTRVDVHA